MQPSVLQISSFLRELGGFIDSHGAAFTALAALWIAVYTVVLAGSIRRLREISDRQVRAQIDSERPWVFIDTYRMRQQKPPDQAIPNNWYIVFRWRNFGRAPALIDELLVHVQDVDTLPDRPDYTKCSVLPCTSRTVAAGETFETFEVGPRDQSTKDGKPIQYAVFGRLQYRDLIGQAHRVGFAVEVSRHMTARSIFQNRNYDYWD